MSDTFRRDHLAAYGDPAPWSRPGHEGEPFIHTPNLDRLAAESALFDRFYVSSYPTVPCRYDLFTGRFGFPTRGWQPLEHGDVVLPELLLVAGITTKTVGLAKNTTVIFPSDHGHLFGDHDLQGKPSGPLGKLYEVTTRVPLLIRRPGVPGSLVDGIFQHPDLAPTVLELFGLEAPGEMHGSSLLGQGREFAVSGRHSPLAAGREPDSDAARFDGTASLATHGEPLTITGANAFYVRPPRGLGQPEGDASRLHESLLGFLREHGMPEDQVGLYAADPERAALLAPETELTAPAGLPYAFVDPKEAALCFPDHRLVAVALGSLAPHALVALDDQYYWAEDLTPG
jgi:hypothetical protein